MSTIAVCNRSPYPLSTAKVGLGTRLSIRSADPIDTTSIQLWTGHGSTYYEPSALPEDVTEHHFVFNTFYGTPVGDVSREIDSGYLKVTKSGTAGDNKRGCWFFGGLESPVEDPRDMILAEFKLLVDNADISPAPTGDEFTGLIFGFFINNTGAMVRLFHSPTAQWIEVWDCNYLSTQRVDPLNLTYKSPSFTWSGVECTYKIVWDPNLDKMLVILSSGEESYTSDTVLIDGKVSDFTTLPVDQWRVNQPYAFFGHGFPGKNSISRWKGCYFHNEVFRGITDGYVHGEQLAFLKSNDIVHLDVSQRFHDNDQPWEPIPVSFDDQDGVELINDSYLSLERTELDKSFGFWRREPKVATDITVVEFEVAGEVLYQAAAVQVSGFEIWIDDGTRAACIGFCYDLVKYAIGILTTNYPNLIGSYTGATLDWTSAKSFRVEFDPLSSVTLYLVEMQDDVVAKTQISSVPYTSLPLSSVYSLPSPGIGLMHDATIGAALAKFSIFRFNYRIGERLWLPTALPASPWVKSGTGTTTIQDGEMALVDSSTTGATYYYRPETLFYHGYGSTLEFVMRIESYGTDTEDNPIGCNTGVGVVLDDGSFQLALLFADGGNILGKVVYFAHDDDYDAALFDVVSGNSAAEGLSAAVDWTQEHLYRVERTVGGKVRLFLDMDDAPIIEWDFSNFPFPGTMGSGQRAVFGSLVTDKKNVSYWKLMGYTVSAGVDIKSNELISLDTLDRRFNQAGNIVVQSEHI